MQHPFDVVAKQNASLISAAHILPARHAEALGVARDRLRYRARYGRLADLTTVLIPVSAAIHMREASGRFDCCMANGERIINTGRKTTLVPRGHGPYMDPDGWEKSGKDAFHIDALDSVARLHGWTQESFIYYTEEFNGWGPHDRGRHSGYPWAGTNIYDGGKYVRDGVWDPNFRDPQLGTFAIYLAMVELAPDLALPRLLPTVTAPTVIPPPVQVVDGFGHDDNLTAAQIQAAMNAFGCTPPLWLDGNYGRGTMRAVRSYEVSRKLSVDRGYAGPQVRGQILKDLEARHLKVSDLDAMVRKFQEQRA